MAAYKETEIKKKKFLKSLSGRWKYMGACNVLKIKITSVFAHQIESDFQIQNRALRN